MNLLDPLTVTDEIQISHQILSTVILTVGLYRSIWISGYRLFFDVRISNRSSKPIKKIESQLEQLTFVFAHATATPDNKLADTIQLPDITKRDIVSSQVHSPWQVDGNSHDQKTCTLEIPSGLISIEGGMSMTMVPTKTFQFTYITQHPLKLHQI